MNIHTAATNYRVIRDRIRSMDPALDEQTLADTVEGLTDLHEILQAVIRAAFGRGPRLGAQGPYCRDGGQGERLQDRAAKRRQIAKEVMTELDIKKLEAPDFTASIRPGMPALVVLDEAEIPSIYWEPRDPKLNRTALSADLKQGAEVAGATLSNPEPILTVRTR
jgi:Siphovirus Gp157